MRIFTVGHSTQTLDELVALVRGHAVSCIADVRKNPGSRRHPQFGLQALARDLPERGVDYRHLPALGGRRRPRPDSPNGGWDHPSFRGYADYALTEAFATGLDELCALARARPTAVMCAEAVWWRCHRRLVADRLVALGWTVCHIGSHGALTEHALTPFGVAQPDGSVLYPPVQGSLLEP